MAFPVKPKMTQETFKSDIVDHYWGADLQDRINQSKDTPAHVDVKVGALVEDYCRIGSFLTHPDKVREALIPLEQALRKEVDTVAPNLKTFDPSAPVHVKANKLLSRVLSQHELGLGFNNPKLYYGDTNATLHSMAMTAPRTGTGAVKLDGGGLPGLQNTGPSGTRPLPSGTAVAMGNVAGRDFNRILLRHGYQFKDVGAGIDHGEYTHRLHWFAIANANLELVNPPAFLYRALGSLWAGGKQNTGTTIIEGKAVPATVYLWEALLDCFPSESVAKAQKSLAWSQAGVFNCPDMMNLDLSKKENIPSMPPVGLPADETLWCLRVLLHVRRAKRVVESRNEDKSYFDNLGNKAKTGSKTIQEAFGSEAKKGERAGLAGLLVWYT